MLDAPVAVGEFDGGEIAAVDPLLHGLAGDVQDLGGLVGRKGVGVESAGLAGLLYGVRHGLDLGAHGYFGPLCPSGRGRKGQMAEEHQHGRTLLQRYL